MKLYLGILELGLVDPSLLLVALLLALRLGPRLGGSVLALVVTSSSTAATTSAVHDGLTISCMEIH